MALADTARLVAALELQDKFSATASKYEKTLGSMERKTSTLEKVSYQVGRGARSAVDNLKTIGVVAGGVAVAGIIKSVKAASDLNETISATSVILGEQALPALKEWSAGAAAAFGQSQQQALDAVNTFATFGKSAGLAGDDLVDFSKELTVLASDLASFKNTTPEEAITAIGAALRGESEPIRRYGVLLDDATLRQRALALGITKTTTQALTPQQKVLAAQAEIFAQTSDAQGDFARTSDSLANTQKSLSAVLTNTAATVGEALTPALAKLGSKLNDLLVKNQPAIKEFGAALPAAFDQLVEIGENIPWEALGASLKLAGQGAKTVLGAFTAMPDWVQTAVLTGWGLNKLTGGAIGNIAGTLTKAAFGGLRGGTPATPVYTKEVGVPGTGGPGTGGLLGRVGGILGFTGIVIAAVEGLHLLEEAIDGVGFAASKEGKDFFSQLFGGGRDTRQGAATPLGQFVPENRGGVPVKVTNTDSITDPAAAAAEGIKGVLGVINQTLEQQLINDRGFKRSITSPQEFIRILKRTSEFGEKGVGTTIEQGPKTGRDPFGEAFVALVKRLDEKTLRNNEVQQEIRAHIKAAREVLAAESKEGDQEAQARLQTTIDTLREILGLGRETNRGISNTVREQVAMRAGLNSGFQRTNAQLGSTNSQLSGANAKLSSINAKDFSPNVNVNANFSTTVSISDVVRQAATYNVATSLSSQLRKGFTPT